jgi:hypothetical protein
LHAKEAAHGQTAASGQKGQGTTAWDGAGTGVSSRSSFTASTLLHGSAPWAPSTPAPITIAEIVSASYMQPRGQRKRAGCIVHGQLAEPPMREQRLDHKTINANRHHTATMRWSHQNET